MQKGTALKRFISSDNNTCEKLERVKKHGI